MKFKVLLKNLTSFVIAMIIAVIGIFCVFSVGEDDSTPEPVATDAQTVETFPVVTEAPTVPQTDYVVTEPVTEPPTVAPETQAPATVPPATNAPVTYAVTQGKVDELPTVDKFIKPTAVRLDENKIREKDDLTYGFASWACVIIGVLTVIVVLISNKTHYSSGSGKQRYEEGNRITGKRRLLDDDYYNTRKHKSYYEKDNRR